MARPPDDQERNRFSARAARYARVGTNVGGVAAKFAASRLLGLCARPRRNASDLPAALGGLKGPIMKVAQLMATIPDLLPPEYVEELQKLQSDAPPMGWAVREAAHDGRARRRLAGEVRRVRAQAGRRGLARPGAPRARARRQRARRKLQYPDMQSAVEADLQQLDWLFAIHRRMDPVIDTTEIAKEIAARVREELDYLREAKHVALYRAMLAGHRSDPRAGRCGRSCRPAGCSPSTGSRAANCSTHKNAPLAHRNRDRHARCSPPGGCRSAASA